jgi:hypothetical protein
LFCKGLKQRDPWYWKLRLSQWLVWRWPSSGLSRCIVW